MHKKPVRIMSGGPSAVVPSLVSVIRDTLYKQGTTKKKKTKKKKRKKQLALRSGGKCKAVLIL